LVSVVRAFMVVVDVSFAQHPPVTFDYSTMDVQDSYEQVVISFVVYSVISLASYFMHHSYIEVTLFCS
jgi:hypothetical protein